MTHDDTTVAALVTCPTCNGKGGKATYRSWCANDPRNDWQDCPTCDGDGQCTEDEARAAIILGLTPDDGD
jgi:DnaJ-class molecular chaperone